MNDWDVEKNTIEIYGQGVCGYLFCWIFFYCQQLKDGPFDIIAKYSLSFGWSLSRYFKLQQ